MLDIFMNVASKKTNILECPHYVQTSSRGPMMSPSIASPSGGNDLRIDSFSCSILRTQKNAAVQRKDLDIETRDTLESDVLLLGRYPEC